MRATPLPSAASRVQLGLERSRCRRPFAPASSRRFDLPTAPWRCIRAASRTGRGRSGTASTSWRARLPRSRSSARAARSARTRGTYFGAAVQLAGARAGLRRPAGARRHGGAVVASARRWSSNDSGLMHVGVALGIPTFGIFGITSPAREAIAAPNMHAGDQGTAVRAGVPARRLGAARLRVPPRMPAVADGRRRAAIGLGGAARSLRPARHRALNHGRPQLTYYGHVFDAIGYGQAARGYHPRAARRGRPLVGRRSDEATAGRSATIWSSRSSAGDLEPDFHLFHGIPPQWARLAFPLRNAIGMTVWETDTMPTQWRNVLSHVIDVWLPCEFNVETFQRDLQTPHLQAAARRCLPRPSNGDVRRRRRAASARAPDDFVFYSMFEWQDAQGAAARCCARTSARFQATKTPCCVRRRPTRARPPSRAQALAEARARDRIGAPASRFSPIAGASAEIEALHRARQLLRLAPSRRGLGLSAVRGRRARNAGHRDRVMPARSTISRRLAAARAVSARAGATAIRYYDPHDALGGPRRRRAAAERMREVRRASRVADRACGVGGRTHRATAIRSSRRRDMARERLHARFCSARTARRFAGASDARDAADTADARRPDPRRLVRRGLFRARAQEQLDGRLYLGGVRRASSRDRRIPHRRHFRSAESYLDAGCAKGFLVRACGRREKTAGASITARGRSSTPSDGRARF